MLTVAQNASSNTFNPALPGTSHTDPFVSAHLQEFLNLCASRQKSINSFITFFTNILTANQPDELKFFAVTQCLIYFPIDIEHFSMLFEIGERLSWREIPIRWQNFFNAYLSWTKENKSASIVCLNFTLLFERFISLNPPQALLENTSLHRELKTTFYQVIVQFIQSRLLATKTQQASDHDLDNVLNILILLGSKFVIEINEEHMRTKREKSELTTPEIVFTAYMNMTFAQFLRATINTDGAKSFAMRREIQPFTDNFRTYNQFNTDEPFFKKIILPMIVDHIYMCLFDKGHFNINQKNKNADVVKLLEIAFKDKTNNTYKILDELCLAQTTSVEKLLVPGFTPANPFLHDFILLNVTAARLAQTDVTKKKNIDTSVINFVLNPTKISDILSKFEDTLRISDDEAELALAARLYLSLLLSLEKIIANISQKISALQLQLENILDSAEPENHLNELKSVDQTKLPELVRILNMPILPVCLESNRQIFDKIRAKRLLTTDESERCGLKRMASIFESHTKNNNQYYELLGAIEEKRVEYLKRSLANARAEIKTLKKKEKPNADESKTQQLSKTKTTQNTGTQKTGSTAKTTAELEEALQAKTTALEEQSAELDGLRNQLRTEMEGFRKERQTLDAKLKKASNETGELQAQLKSAKEAEAIAKKESVAKDEKLAQQKKELGKLTTDLQLKTREAETLKTAQEPLVQEREQAKAAKEHAEKEVAQLKRDLAALQQELKSHAEKEEDRPPTPVESAQSVSESSVTMATLLDRNRKLTTTIDSQYEEIVRLEAMLGHANLMLQQFSYYPTVPVPVPVPVPVYTAPPPPSSPQQDKRLFEPTAHGRGFFKRAKRGTGSALKKTEEKPSAPPAAGTSPSPSATKK